jgi:hypothetical protein
MFLRDCLRILCPYLLFFSRNFAFSTTGDFLDNAIYKTEVGFRKGSVVFKEWNTAKRMTVIEIQPGAKLAFGRLAKQDLDAAKALSGKMESLSASDDLQFVLLDGRLNELIANGSALVKLIESGIETGF